jgi:hypothetical protein
MELIGMSLGIWLVGTELAAAQTPRDAFEVLRADLKADRKALIAKEMNFAEHESQGFWPVYDSYRAEMEKVADGLGKLVLEYRDLYPNVPEQKASQLLQEYSRLEGDQLDIKRKYVKKLGKVLPTSKVFRFVQLDNRFDLATRVALAAKIPLLSGGQAPSPDAKP